MRWMIACALGLVSVLGADECYDECCESYWDLPIWCESECCEPVWGEWLSEEPILFRPFVADPKQVCFSVGWRFNDRVLTKNVIPVSFGDNIQLYRWHNVWPWCGDLQIEIEGCVWAQFDPLHESSPLINADYYVGFPLTYAVGNWQFRLRGYHISTHIGDEYLMMHGYHNSANPGSEFYDSRSKFKRVNPSGEFLDFFVSNDFTQDIRFYGGLGFIVHQDESFRRKRFFGAIGTEVRMRELGFVDCCQLICGTPIFAMHLRTDANYKKHVDITYALGYEWGKLYGLERRLRAQLEYHDGYSPDGQFCKKSTNYLQARITYGF
jgi:hypothetical protein